MADYGTLIHNKRDISYRKTKDVFLLTMVLSLILSIVLFYLSGLRLYGFDKINLLLKTLFGISVFSFVSFPLYLCVLFLIGSHFIEFFYTIQAMFCLALILISFYTSKVFLIVLFIYVVILSIVIYFNQRFYKVTQLSVKNALILIRTNFTHLIIDLALILITNLMVVFLFNCTNTFLLQILDQDNFQDAADTLIKNPSILKNWKNSAAFVILLINCCSYFVFTSVQKWLAFSFGALFLLRTENKEDNKTVTEVMDESYNTIYDQLLGTISKMSLLSIGGNLFIILTSREKYRYWYKCYENKVDIKEQIKEPTEPGESVIEVTCWEKIIFTVFPFILDTTMFYTKQALLFSVKTGNDLLKSSKESIIYFYSRNKAHLFELPTIELFFIIESLLLSFLLSFLQIILINATKGRTNKLFKLNISLNLFLTVFPFISVANNIVSGASYMIVQERINEEFDDGI